jgi:D-beta-D-heptose 7-phosphate kinase/D-beta-D-heptose 1-phosphate adenosyltransferase
MKKQAVIVSGYFNPIHKGHIEYFHNAKSLGGELWVIVNNDEQRKLKGSKEFQKEEERCLIITELEVVDRCILSLDKDRTVIESLKTLYQQFSYEYDLFFANGGDQDNKTIPESVICDELGITLIDGLGDKIQSSNWLLNK